MSGELAHRHHWPIRVYYEDTDAAGIVYYANYLKFAERARTEFLREAGFDHIGLMESDGVGFVVRRSEAEYRNPAKLDDALVVETKIEHMSGARFTMRQTVLRNDMILCDMTVTLGCINGDGRAVRLPKLLREALNGG